MSSEVKIHPTAIVEKDAELDSGVSIGAYSIVGKNVKIGKNTDVGPHVVIGDWTTIGADCKFFHFSSVGVASQDLSYKGEKAETIIGDKNIIREFVTIHRGTLKQEGVTRCGSGNLFMNYVHVAHDCIVGNGNVLANAATLAGHVTVEDFSIIGGLVAVHQFVRIGSYSIIGGASAVAKDIPPYVMAVGNRATLRGLNLIGLKRRGFSKEEITEIKNAYKSLFRSGLPVREAAGKLRTELKKDSPAQRMLDFIDAAKRGVARAKSSEGGDDDEM